MTEAPTAPVLRRQPSWSGFLTRPLGHQIPEGWSDGVLLAIKAVHTVIFFSLAGAVVLSLWDGLRSSPRRRTAIAGGAVLVESALYVSNNQVCPLTPLAEELGAERGSVVDMFLPTAVAERIPLVAGSAALMALFLNVRALARRRSQGRPFAQDRHEARIGDRCGDGSAVRRTPDGTSGTVLSVAAQPI